MSNVASSELLLTELEIKGLLVRERYYRDTCQWSKLRESWHPDSSKTNVKITWFQGNIDGFVGGSQRMAQAGANSMHTICPVIVQINGDKAVSESTGSILARFKHEESEYDCTSYARFISRLERVQGQWKLLSLEAIYEKDMIHPVKPEGSLRTFNIDASSRPSYRCLAWVLVQKGFEIDQTLPGVDIPSSVETLMNSCYDWLRGSDKTHI